MAADAVAPTGLSAQKESARAEQNRGQNNGGNPADGATADKAFLTLRALLALKGFGLNRTRCDDGPVHFYVTRWGMVRELRDLEAVAAFAKQAGGDHG